MADCSLSELNFNDYVVEQRFTVDREADPEVFTVLLRVVTSGHTCAPANGITLVVQGSDEDLCIAWDNAVQAALAASEDLDDALCP